MKCRINKKNDGNGETRQKELASFYEQFEQKLIKHPSFKIDDFNEDFEVKNKHWNTFFSSFSSKYIIDERKMLSLE